MEFAAIDFETAGAKRGETDEPVQIGIVIGTIQEGVIDHFDSYIKPQKEVMWQASRVHGITTEHLRGAPSYLSLWPDVQRCLTGRVLVAHACGTEKRLLRPFVGQKFEPWVDSLTLGKAAMPDLESHRLGALLPYLGEEFANHPINAGRQWHDALYDAGASFFFVKRIVEELALHHAPLSVLLQPNTKKYHALRNRNF